MTASASLSGSAVPPVVPVADLPQRVGQELAVGEWMPIAQERIAAFADATDDHQWIHLDVARAAAESPYGGTIAHGLLTLSLIVPMVERAVRLQGVRLLVNYGFDRVRFPAAVPAGGRVRARVTVGATEWAKDGALQVTWKVAVELEGSEKPAAAADWVVRIYT
jgi:acyl dehydratase